MRARALSLFFTRSIYLSHSLLPSRSPPLFRVSVSRDFFINPPYARVHSSLHRCVADFRISKLRRRFVRCTLIPRAVRARARDRARSLRRSQGIAGADNVRAVHDREE